MTGTPSNQAHACPFHKPEQIKLGGMRKQVVALEGSVCGEYLLGCWREACRKTVMLKKSGCTYQALTRAQSWSGCLQTLLPVPRPLQTGCYRCCSCNTQEKQGLSSHFWISQNSLCDLLVGRGVEMCENFRKQQKRQCLSTSSARCPGC